MHQPQDFASLVDFVEHLKTKAQIVGILQYGQRDYRDMGPGGDFDLNVVVDSGWETAIAGMHFHVAGIPVDCGIISEKDLFADQAPSDYHCVLLQSTLLFDRSGVVAQGIEHIKTHWRLEIPQLKEGEIAFERFIRQHIIDKFEHRLQEDEVYTRLFLSGNVFWLLELYMKTEGLNPYDFKGALAHMKRTQAHTYALFEKFELTHDLSEKLALTKRMNEAVLKKIGGPWKKDEIIFHYGNEDDTFSEAEKKQVVNLIF